MRRLTLLTLALMLAGCDPAGVDFDPVETMRVAIVSGDGQVEPVDVQLEAVAVAASGKPLFVDPLVAELRDGNGNRANPEPGTQVSFVSTEPEICTPFTLTASPDDSARVQTRAEKGTTAGGCHIEARRVLPDGTAVVDTVFSLTVTHGPADGETSVGLGGLRGVGTQDELGLFDEPVAPFADDLYQDAYGNLIPYRVEATQFITVSGTDPTTDSARTAYVDAGVQAGDTATMRLLTSTGDLLLDLAVEAQGGVGSNGIAVMLVTVREITY